MGSIRIWFFIDVRSLNTNFALFIILESLFGQSEPTARQLLIYRKCTKQRHNHEFSLQM